MDLTNLKRQHNEIIELAGYILSDIKNNTVDKNIDNIVKSINTISGKLKIHLLSEDECLYPNLLSSSDAALNMFGKKYYEEMSEVTKGYDEYKAKYNTSSKIKKNIGDFKEDTERIFSALSNRVEREETELYPLLG
ncbi:hemerythrin domain-containing protein [Ruminiclostridium herbifermentans]|uniref:Hemerythrin domain-containing protein n=1 Tax=Ruminiclostridium herbifermentans TaxID=2488810 RepID=A0A7H1VQN1_9FIRM|nr:hemerythrin domain-containing protein [Ruminiclostridium herbifermentans]QNU67693.1 hemerythrin domain-containing protein [Ruminiclostridium herbifermentans]